MHSEFYDSARGMLALKKVYINRSCTYNESS